MHIGMRLLHPAAADHSVSISRQQVQCILCFSRWKSVFIVLLLTSAGEWFQRVEHALQENFRAGGTALQLRWFFSCRVDCSHQVALPPVFVVGDHLPCVLQHTKRAFSLKKYSRVHLFKCCIWLTRRYILVKSSWVLLQTTCYPCASGCGCYLASGDGHNRCLTMDESSSHCGKMIISELQARLRYLDKGAKLCCLCLDLVLVLAADRRGLLQAVARVAWGLQWWQTVQGTYPQGTIAPLALRNVMSSPWDRTRRF